MSPTEPLNNPLPATDTPVVQDLLTQSALVEFYNANPKDVVEFLKEISKIHVFSFYLEPGQKLLADTVNTNTGFRDLVGNLTASLKLNAILHSPPISWENISLAASHGARTMRGTFHTELASQEHSTSMTADPKKVIEVFKANDWLVTCIFLRIWLVHFVGLATSLPTIKEYQDNTPATEQS